MTSLVQSARALETSDLEEIADLEVPDAEVGERRELRRRLSSRLEGFAQTGRGILMLSLPAPRTAPEALFDLADLPQSFFWHAPQGAAFAGQGAVQSLRASGPDRFHELREQAVRLLAEVVGESVYGDAAEPARLWGGLAFDEGAASAAPWTAFGDAELFLPRFLYRCPNELGQAASLSLAITAAEAAEPRRRETLLDQLDALLEGLRKHSETSPLELMPEPGTSPTGVSAQYGFLSTAETTGENTAETDEADWVRQVDDIRQAIARGEVEKIVAARRFRVEVGADLRVSAVLRRLARGLRSSTRFAFRHREATGDATFLGASPERLVSKRGSMLETEALAGTMEAGGEHATQLLESGKNRHEQQLVTDSIVRRLRPLCSHLEVADRPTVRELREILHLHTPIRGVLKDDHHVLDLVEALHPTPAVGGVPTPEALRWIGDHESHPRGWYAAPIGWLDGQGDGEFYVALRSCVVTAGMAYLYAGAGIVGDSDPLAELRETELKTHVLLKALRS